MNDILYSAIDMLKNYEKWLSNHKIDPKYVRTKCEANEKQMLLTAYSRKNKNWNLTKKQLQLIAELKERSIPDWMITRPLGKLK